MVLGYEQVVFLGRTDGIIPPINTPANPFFSGNVWTFGLRYLF